MAASAPNTPNTPDPRPTGDLEHLFRQKFAEAEVTPRASFWDQLDHELVVQQNEQVVQENVTYRRRLVLHRWVAAACLLLALGFGSWAFLWQNGQAFGPELAANMPQPSAGTTGPSSRMASGGYSSGTGSAGGELVASNGLDGATIAQASGAAEFSSLNSSSGTTHNQSGLGNMLAGLYSSSADETTAGQARNSYNTFSSIFAGNGASRSETILAGFGAMPSRTAHLRSLLGLGRPDTLKPSLLAAPQPMVNDELAAVKEPEQPETPKLWRRLKLGGSYAVGSYNPNINFSHTDGRLKADPVTNALRNYYQDEAENEYRRNLRAGTSQRVALTASYALNDRWAILSGAEVAEQRATSATTYGFIDGKQLGREAADLFSRPAAYLAPAKPRTTSYRYRTATVPVSVQYGSRKPGLSVYAKVGAAVSVLLSSHSELEGSPEASRTHTLSSSESPYRRVLTSVRGGTGVRYQPAAARWSVAVGPTAEAGLTTLNANPSQRTINQSRPYSVGLEASVEFGSAKTPPVAQ